MPRDLAADQKSDPPGYGIAAVGRTIDLLAAMARLGPSTLTSLATASGCTRVNAFRILHTLEAHGLASQEGKRGAWRLGAGWLGVGLAAERDGLWARAGEAPMTALAQSCGEAVVLTVRDGEQALVAAVQPSTPGLRHIASLGERWPLHGGPGRLLLAHAPAGIIRAVLTTRLARTGPATVIDPKKILTELARIRAREWLLTTDELAESTVTASVPVRHGGAAVVAVLSIVGPGFRMRAPRPHTLLSPLQAAAEEIARVISPASAGTA